jgi:hypothetical protein
MKPSIEAPMRQSQGTSSGEEDRRCSADAALYRPHRQPAAATAPEGCGPRHCSPVKKRGDLKRPRTGTSWKTLALPLIRRVTIFLPTLWQSDQVS